MTKEVLDYFAEADRAKAEAYEEAVKVAQETGKEPFDWEKLRTSVFEPKSEESHRYDYYVRHPEIRTMDEYVAHRREMEVWGV